MADKRTDGQKQVLILMQEPYLDLIDSQLESLGFSDRASFIREAVRAQLEAEGVDVPREITIAPSRTGKGGRPRKVKAAEDQVEYKPKKK